MGLGHAESSPEGRQRAAHGAHGDRRPAVLLHLQAEQLAGPRRSAPPEVLRRALEKLRDPAPEGVADLGLPVAAPLIVQPRDALLGEPMRRAHDRRACDLQFLGDLGLVLPKPSRDVKAQCCHGVAALSAGLYQEAAINPAHSGYDVHAWGLPC